MTERDEQAHEMMLDGNAVAGLLQEVFGVEMTTQPTRCAHCGQTSQIGALQVYGQQMGKVLRCPCCEQVVMRIVERPDGVLFEMRGVQYMRLGRRA